MEKTPRRLPGALSAANLTALSCLAGPDVALVDRIRGYQRIWLSPGQRHRATRKCWQTTCPLAEHPSFASILIRHPAHKTAAHWDKPPTGAASGTYRADHNLMKDWIVATVRSDPSPSHSR